MNKIKTTPFIVFPLVLLFTLIISCSKDEIILQNEIPTKFEISKISKSKAKIGEEITIYGNGFNSEIEIIFNDFDNKRDDQNSIIKILPTNDKVITIKVPNGARTGYIELIKNNEKIKSKTDFLVANSWRKVADFPGEARSQTIHFSHQDKGFIGLGGAFNRGVGHTYFNDLWSYDYKKNIWEKKASLGTSNNPGKKRREATSVLHGDKIYVGFGTAPVNDITFIDFYAYDIINNTWKRKKDLPSTNGYSVTNPISFAKDDNLYFIGGGINVLAIKRLSYSVYKYNIPSNSWTLNNKGLNTNDLYDLDTHLVNNEIVLSNREKLIKITSINNNTNTIDYSTFGTDIPEFDGIKIREGSTSFSYQEKIFVGLGKGTGNKSYKKSFIKFENNQWSRISDFPGSPRTGASSFVIKDRAYIGGGWASNKNVNDFYEYTIE